MPKLSSPIVALLQWFCLLFSWGLSSTLDVPTLIRIFRSFFLFNFQFFFFTLCLYVCIWRILFVKKITSKTTEEEPQLGSKALA
uniref:Secreted protein n=1 Tax=Lutzomyia longipalpis TaxID=7200 RepID=A0A7G3B876_LUTLO